MSPNEFEHDPWTPERRKLQQWFQENAPRLADPYVAAVRLLSDRDFPARPHLVGHLVREIANGLPEAVTGRRVRRFDTTKALDDLATEWSDGFARAPSFSDAASTPPPEVAVPAPLVNRVSGLVRDHAAVKDTARDQTAALIDALRPGSRDLRVVLEPVLREWSRVVAWFVSQTHLPRGAKAQDVDDLELKRQFRRFEDGIRGITQGHFRVVREIDSILDSSAPSRETLDSLLPLLGGAEQLRYFFSHPRLAEPEWLRVLEGRGFFASVPEPRVEDHDGEGVTIHAVWPASRYLDRMAAQPAAQEDVARLGATLRTANVLVRDDAIAIAAKLPPSLAAQMIPAILESLRKTRWHHVRLQGLGQLLASQARSGRRRAAIRLFSSLVAVRPREQPAGREDHDLLRAPQLWVAPQQLDRMLGEHLASVVDGLGVEALRILSKALSRGVRLHRSKFADADEDYSYIWRPEIESAGDDETLDVLLNAVVNAAERLLETKAANLAAILDEFERRPWPVFRRLELYLLAKASSPPAECVATRILDRRLFDGRSTTREYRMLLASKFGTLSNEKKAEWLSWMEAGIPADEVRGFLQRWHGDASDDDVARFQRRWQWEHLAPVRSALDGPWETRWAALRDEFGEPAGVDAAEHGHFSASMGSESPLDEAEVARKSPEELAQCLRALVFPPERPFSSPEGTREVVERVVARAPEAYSREARVFQGLEPTYVRGVLGGFTAAAKEKLAFDWDGALELARWVLSQPTSEPEPKWDLRQDPGWGWTRHQVIDLLTAGLRPEPSPLPLAARAAVWALITDLLRGPNAVNRADAFEAALQYAFWVRAHQGRSWDDGDTLDDVPEVRSALDELVTQDESPSVSQAIGSRLAWLVRMDEAWIRSRLGHVFPTGPDHRARWDAAWLAYLRAGALPDRVFRLLEPVYQTAIDRLDPSAKGARRLGSPEGYLVEHLALLCGRGTLEASPHRSILDSFFEKASGGLRRHFHWYVGHSLKEHEELIPGDVLRRFQDLWTSRLQQALGDPRAREELPSFGMWFGSGRFEPAWALQQLEAVLDQVSTIDYEHLVVERLAELAPSHTQAVVRCLRVIVLALKEPGPVHGWLEGAKAILTQALRDGDDTARQQALDVYHRLGTLGFRAHDILPFSADLDDPVAIPYFTWDHPMTVAELRAKLESASEPERDRLLGLILREAKDTDVWHFTRPQEVASRWSRLAPHLGRKREFWQGLLGEWREQGLLAS